jgi:4-deoxy-L-threo-5-hexosulose-uronate ketol-isomerase
METKIQADNIRYERMNTQEMRDSFLLTDLFKPGESTIYYLSTDRAVVGGIVPTKQPIALETAKELAADYFAQRREIGVLNLGQPGTITVDGQKYTLENEDCLYIGRGSKEISFASAKADQPAQFYMVSFPAHANYPTAQAKKSDATPIQLGSAEKANVRTIYKYIHQEGIKSCQLVMGITTLSEGSVWNTMPCHTHARRMEVYLYFDLNQDDVLMHFMGPPEETRHLVVRDREAIVSPSWSIHSGVATKNYSFAWGMGGENQEFTDMDKADMSELA